MHSSRMRTARWLTVSGGELPSKSRSLPSGGGGGGGGSMPPHAIMGTPVNRMTHTSETLSCPILRMRAVNIVFILLNSVKTFRENSNNFITNHRSPKQLQLSHTITTCEVPN